MTRKAHLFVAAALASVIAVLIFAKSTLLATGITPPSTMGYNHDLTPYSFDPDGTGKLLAKVAADRVPSDAGLSPDPDIQAERRKILRNTQRAAT